MMDQFNNVELDKKKALNAILAVQGVWIVCFFISACAVAKNANDGFNVVVTALLYIAYEAYFVYVVNKRKPIEGTVDVPSSMRPMVGGVLIGSTVMFVFVSLMTAIYWGQYSGCQSGYDDIDGYSCLDPSGMRSVCAFCSLLFITHLLMVAVLIRWKDDLFVTADQAFDSFEGDQGASYAYNDTGADKMDSQADL